MTLNEMRVALVEMSDAGAFDIHGGKRGYLIIDYGHVLVLKDEAIPIHKQWELIGAIAAFFNEMGQGFSIAGRPTIFEKAGPQGFKWKAETYNGDRSREMDEPIAAAIDLWRVFNDEAHIISYEADG